jgi:S-adenosyl-L-methionine hydrolase (adenosine-forming)
MPELPKGSVFVCVVDPGVGSDRRPLVVSAGGHSYVGPDTDGIKGAASVCRADWPADLAGVVCVDPYGNLVSGVRAEKSGADVVVEAAGRNPT